MNTKIQNSHIFIEGYGLLYNGKPLCVDTSYKHGHWVLTEDEGMPYIVDLHAFRYFLTYAPIYRPMFNYPNYAPEDPGKLLGKAEHCSIQIAMDGRVEVAMGDFHTSTFSLEVQVQPLDEDVEPYKVLPKDCLIDTKGVPIPDTIVKVMKYTPSDLKGEYVDDYGYYVDTYMNTPAGTPHCHVFRREYKQPVFYSTVTIPPRSNLLNP